jgi:methyl-accepting chemotaxis protein
MNLTIGKKLGFSFGIILLLMSISAIVTHSSILEIEEAQNRVIDLRMKTVLLGKDVVNGINQSLAGLRGYMILGANPKKAQAMKDTREKAWLSIEIAMKDFDVLANSWTVPTNIERLKRIKSELALFKTAQQEIENISHAEENISSYQLLLTEAAPRAGKMLQSISAIIDEESRLAATPARKLLLKNLADTRGSFAISLANIRAYLLSGDSTFKNTFDEQ